MNCGFYIPFKKAFTALYSITNLDRPPSYRIPAKIVHLSLATVCSVTNALGSAKSGARMHPAASANQQQQQQHHYFQAVLPSAFPQVQLAQQPAAAAAAGHGSSANWVRLAALAAPGSSAAAAAVHPAFLDPNLVVHLRSGLCTGHRQAQLPPTQVMMAGRMPPPPPPPPTYVPPDHHVQQAGKAAAPMPTIYTAPTRAYAQLVAMPPHVQAVHAHQHCHQSAASAAQPLPPPHVMLPTAAAVPMPATTAAVVGGGFPTAGTSMASGHNRLPPPAISGGGNGTPEGAENGNNKNCAGGGDCWSTAVTGWEQAAIIKNKIGLLINGRFRILQSIASGSYGEIFAAEDLQHRRHRVAVKFDGACRDNHLRYEYQVYKSALYEDGNGKVDGFPQVYWYGHEYGHNILVMELLGAPVASLFAFCDRKFARQTIVSLGEQMIHRIRHLHQRGFIHRDIKPENFLMGLAGKESTLYLIDFGLARRYRYRENRALTHIPFRRGRNFIGTAKYASLNSHKNIELSRRDDLESLAYVLIELVSGHLPWKNISKRNATTRHQASQRIRGLKELTNWDEFCPPMAKFIKYCREIPFNEEPDYDRLLDLLQLITVLLPEYNSSSISCLGPYAAPAVVAAAAAAARCRAEKKLTPMALPAAVPLVAEAAAAAIMARAVCCQTPETAEKMTQVDFETAKMYANEAAQKMASEAQIVAEEDTETVSVTRVVASTMQRLSMKVAAENGTGSDIEEVGAATTTTSCSDNELLLDSGGGGGCMTGRGGESSATGELRSVVGTAVSDGDDELTADSQPMPQQHDQPPPVCRKCRRLRDQQNQQQKRSQQQQQQQQRAVSPPPQQPKRVEQSLQTEALLLMPPHKMCWQQARDSNPERRFQYENRFSWTVDKQQQQQHQQGGMIMTTGGPAVDEHHYQQQQQQYQQHVQAVHHLQQQQQHVQTVQLQHQQHQQQQLAAQYKLRAGAALPIGVPQLPPQFVHHLHQQQQQQHYVAPPQFLLQQQANCPNGQIPPAHHPFGIVVPNSGVASAAAPVPYQTQATAAASAAAFRAVAATQPPQQHYHHVHNQQLLPAAVAAQFVMPPPQQPPPVVSQCQQIQMAKFGANLNRPLQQPPPAPVTVVAPPPMQQRQQQHQQQYEQQQQQRRFMHIAFVLPPPSPAVVDVAPPQAPRAMLAPAGKQNGGSVPNC